MEEQVIIVVPVRFACQYERIDGPITAPTPESASDVYKQIISRVPKLLILEALPVLLLCVFAFSVFLSTSLRTFLPHCLHRSPLTHLGVRQVAALFPKSISPRGAFSGSQLLHQSTTFIPSSPVPPISSIQTNICPCRGGLLSSVGSRPGATASKQRPTPNLSTAVAADRCFLFSEDSS